MGEPAQLLLQAKLKKLPQDLASLPHCPCGYFAVLLVTVVVLVFQVQVQKEDVSAPAPQFSGTHWIFYWFSICLRHSLNQLLWLGNFKH